MPTYRDLYEIAVEALEQISQIIEEAKNDFDELYFWGIKGAEGELDIPPQYVSEELDDADASI